MNQLIRRDSDRIDNKVKDPQLFFNHIFNAYGEGLSIHKEKGHYFLVDDDFREKSEIFYTKINKNLITS